MLPVPSSLSLLAMISWTAAGAYHYTYESIITNYKNQYSKTLHRDVCVIGGGASGTHAAVSLKQAGRSVVIVERSHRLGGNTLTYIDPLSKIPIDIGVVVFQPLPAVYNFFSKFNVSLANISDITPNAPGQPANLSVPAALYQTTSVFRDLRFGTPVNITGPNNAQEVGQALAGLADILARYEYILHGFHTLPDPPPEDLVMPFGDFMTKYNLTAAIPVVFSVGQGLGSLLHVPTLYVVKYFNLGDLRAFSTGTGYLTQKAGNNSLLYTRAAEFLGSENILYESTVIEANRQRTPQKGNGQRMAQLLVSSIDGGVTLLKCGQILLTIPPTLTNLAGWDLTPHEQGVFSKFTKATGYWTGLIRGVGLNQTIAAQNVAQTSPFNLPILPALYQVAAVGVANDIWWMKIGADTATLPDESVKARALRQVQKLVQQATTGISGTETKKPEWLIFDSHSPFILQVEPESLRGGFYKDLVALQGGLGGTMFYSGAAFHMHYSGYLWRYNEEVVIPKMLRKK